LRVTLDKIGFDWMCRLISLMLSACCFTNARFWLLNFGTFHHRGVVFKGYGKDGFVSGG
jgi:hypothetical protein